MLDRNRQSPALARAFPFAVFIVLTFFQDYVGPAGRYWVYLAKTILTAAALLLVLPHVESVRWRFSVPAIVAGVGVFAFWVGLDGLYPPTTEIYPRYICPVLVKVGLAKSCSAATPGPMWNPNLVFGPGSGLAVMFVVVRIIGASLVVPPVEELFWRSFVYRYIARRNFAAEPLGRFFPVSFVLTSVLFGLEHREWLAGILCGFVYQGLAVWKNRIEDAVTAHAITNLLLGVWVVLRGAWQFW